MSEQKQILEKYLKAKFNYRPALTITRLDKLADGWESDNHLLSVEYGDTHTTRENWVWRIYSGAGNREKAMLEFNSMEKLYAAGYPVPRVFLFEADDSPVDRPFMIMEYIQGEVMWHLLDNSPLDKQERLIDQFCDLYVQLHNLDWKLFNDNLPTGNPSLFIDRWLDEARKVIQKFPDFNVSPFLEWVTVRSDLFACDHPSPIHQDFHPGNVLVKPDGSVLVIDWAHFDVSDFRFDLAWTLVLAHAHGWPGMRDQILQRYEQLFGKAVAQIEAFEAVACARRLFDITVSLTYGPEHMGMTAQATDAIRASMGAHRRVFRLFKSRTGLQIEAFERLFGKQQG